MTDRGETSEVKIINKHLKFNGETGKFSYYDKDKKENINVPLYQDPLGFILLSTGYNISWFDKANKCKVYSNEIKYLKDEKLIVRSMKGWIIVEWLYSEIKDTLATKDYKLHLCITFLDGTEVNRIAFKAAAFYKVSEALKKINIVKNKVMCTWMEEWKQGKITYQMPIFVEGWEINKEEDERANDMLDIIKANRKVVKKPAVEDRVEEEHEMPNTTNDDLPF